MPASGIMPMQPSRPYGRVLYVRAVLALIAFIVGVAYSAAQDGNVGIGTTTPDRSAILDLVARDKGLLIPRLTTIERNAMMVPANGLLIYNVSSSRFEFNAGTALQPVWRALVATQGDAGADRLWMLGGNAGIRSGDVLGTTDTAGLRIVTNSIERLRIDGADGNVTVSSLAGNGVTTVDTAEAGLVVAMQDGRLVKVERALLRTLTGVHAGRYVNEGSEPQFNVVIVLSPDIRLESDASITVTPEATTSVSAAPCVVRSSRLTDRFTISFPGGLNPGEAINWMVVNR